MRNEPRRGKKPSNRTLNSRRIEINHLPSRLVPTRLASTLRQEVAYSQSIQDDVVIFRFKLFAHGYLQHFGRKAPL